MFAEMTNRDFYRYFRQQVNTIYPTGEATIITDWIFESKAMLYRADILKHPDVVLVPEKMALLTKSLAALLQHTPVQYVTGEAWFYKMKLKVNNAVLIPRPETEELVQQVLTTLGNQKGATSLAREISILDVGTGSGCIAIALKKKLAGASVYALDVSSAAISLAMENAAEQQVDVNFIQLDFLQEPHWGKVPVVDVIVSNPPYIPMAEKSRLAKNVTDFEPAIALFVPDMQPLLFYEKIAAFGKTHLAAGGKIFVEIHEDFAAESAAVFANDYTVVVERDAFGKNRMLIASMTIA